MKFTLSWLKEHLDTDEPLDKLADKLTMIGLEVENIEDKAKALAPFSIARVISAEQHPNADRLRVCMVDTGNGAAPVQVVCGAPNARAGLVSVFSPPGTFIPGKNITLGVGTIRGVESRGMLCSAAELEISEDHDGIMELPADAPIGKGYAEWAGLGDPVLEINLTPNRQDCTGAPPSPVSTMHTRKRSAFGCCSAEITRAMENGESCFALSSMFSTSSPIMVSLSASFSSGSSVSRCSFSQESVNFMV